MGKYCFGIDVGGTSVKCGLFQTDGVLVEKWEIPTRKENSGEAILPDIAKTILDKIAERKLDKEEIDGVGIGVPGPVNERGEVPCAVNLFWGFKEVTKELTELTGLPSKAGNDANVAALGEAWKGAAAGAKNVILVTLGTGVGGGIIVDGKIVGGVQGLREPPLNLSQRALTRQWGSRQCADSLIFHGRIRSCLETAIMISPCLNMRR